MLLELSVPAGFYLIISEALAHYTYEAEICVLITDQPIFGVNLDD